MSVSQPRRSSRIAAQKHLTSSDGSANPSPLQPKSNSSLQDLPGEIIDLIAKHLRAQSWTYRWPHFCYRDEAKEDPLFSMSTAPASTYADPSWALSCTSKRLRGIVFDGCIDRRTKIGYCQWCWNNASAIPERIRENISDVTVVVNFERHLVPCDCGDCESCEEYGPAPEDLCDMLHELYPNLKSATINWDVNGDHGPQLTPNSKDRGLDSLTDLKLYIRYDQNNYAQNLMSDAAEIINHFHLPVLQRLTVNIDSLEHTDFLFEGCKLLATVVGDIASPYLDTFRLDIDGLSVLELPHAPIWPYMEKFIDTLLQRTNISRFTSNIQYDISEDTQYPLFANLDERPGTEQIAGYLRTMLPTKAAFAGSADKFITSRLGKHECAVVVNLAGAIWSDPSYRLVKMRYRNSTITTLATDADDDVTSHHQAITQRSNIPASKGIQNRIKYDIFDGSIVKLARYLTHED